MSVTLTAGTPITVNGVAYVLCTNVEADPAVPTVLYPRLMWTADGQELTVTSADEEASKLAEGCRLTPEAPTVEPEPVPVDGPTFGPADDGTGEGPTFGPPHEPLL